MTNSRLIEIPLKDNESIIELSKDNLPGISECFLILRQETCPLSVWIELAMEYYRQGHHEAFVDILEASRSEASLNYENSACDQMIALDSLASFYVQKASKEKRRHIRKNLFNQATLLYTTADKINIYDMDHLLGRAYLCLLEGDKIDQAEGHFSYVLNQIPTSVPAILGRASTAFLQKDYKTALGFYRRALRLCPKCPADVRIGIGTCLIRLNRLDKGRLAFDRALQLKPDSIGALVGMAVLDINGHDSGSIRNGIQRLTQAYSLDSANPVVLNHLAEHFFFRKDFQRVKQLALHAFHNTDNELIKAESCFQLARTFHCSHDYAQAFQYYYQSTQFASSTFVLPHYGLGQMYIQRKDITNAIACFKKVLAVCPDSYEAMRILGSILLDSPDPDNQKLSTEYLRKVTKRFPEDIEAWIDLGSLVEGHSPTEALQAYTNAVNLMKSSSKDITVSSEILNNIASLHVRLNQFNEAVKIYKLALSNARANVDGTRRQSSMNVVTISYNLALLYERMSRYLQAEHLYKKIVRSHPNYVDAVLRLGCMARDRGQIYEASDWFKDALQFDQQNLNAWSLFGNLHMAKEEWRLGQRKYERITENPENSQDVYSLIAMGNIWLNMLYNPQREREKDKRYQARALTIYRNVLSIDPKNIWAVNGIACVLARKRFFNEARDLFSQVREATADFKDVWLNIAHIYVEQGQYHPAIRMYESCYQKFEKRPNPEILIYLARALFRGEYYKECLNQLLNARKVWPDEPILKYNIALVQQQMSIKDLQDQKSNLEKVLRAVRDLRTAQRTFRNLTEQLLQQNDQHKPQQQSSSQSTESSNGGDKLDSSNGGRFSRDVINSLAGSQAQKCADILNQAQYHVDCARQADMREKELRHQQEVKRKQHLEETERLQIERLKELDLLKEEQKAKRNEYLNKCEGRLTAEAFEVDNKPANNRKSRKGKATKSFKSNEECFDTDNEDNVAGNGGDNVVSSDGGDVGNVDAEPLPSNDNDDFNGDCQPRAPKRKRLESTNSKKRSRKRTLMEQ